MKKLLFALCLYMPSLLFAQQDPAPAYRSNIIKLNLTALAFRSISVQYEHQVSRKFSLGVTARYMPDGDVPMKSLIKNIADDPETSKQIDNATIGSFAITPEARFYLGKGNMRGFYIAPFVSFANYTASLDYAYDDNGTSETIPLSGSVNTITGGFLLGTQYHLSSRLSIDLWILGPHYGFSKGDLTGKKSLSSTEQQSLRDELDNLDIPLTKTTYTVDANGATVNFKGPWGGIRSGISLGLRF